MDVLILDDEVQLVRHLAGYLGSLEGEFHVHSAFTGEEAVQLLKSIPIDILLTDVRLPGIDGIEVVRQALEMKPGLRVVVMTAFSSPTIRDLALREGALRFIEKPLDLGELRLLLTEVHECGRGWSGTVGGLDIFDIAQLLAMTQRSKALRIQSGRERAVLIFVEGRIMHASTMTKTGEDAFYEMALWGGGTFTELSEKEASAYAPNVTASTSHLVLEAARLKDEAHRDDLSEWSAESAELEQGVAASATGTPTKSPSQPGGRRSSLLTERRKSEIREKYGLNADKLEEAVELVRGQLGDSLIVSDILAVEDDRVIAGFNRRPGRSTPFLRITSVMRKALAEAGYPELDRYYMIDLAGGTTAMIIHMGTFFWRLLVDTSRTPASFLVSVVIPAAIAACERAKV